MNPQRIVTTVPSTTHILRLLGLVDKIIAADSVSARELGEKVVSLGDSDSINFEKIIELAPDLVLATDTIPGADAMIQQLEDHDFPILTLHTERFDDVLSDIYSIGVECGAEAKARDVVAEMNDRVKQITRFQVSRVDPVPCYVELWPSPFVSVGSQNWVSDMLHRAGGVNIFQDVANPTFWPEEEEIIERSPELIFVLWRGFGDDINDFDMTKILTRPGWQNIPAIRGKRIVALPESLFTYPGPKLIEGLELLVQHLAAVPTLH